MTRPSNVRWHMMGIVVVASAAAYVLRVNVSIAAPTIKTDLGLTDVQLGLVLSAFVTTYAAFQIPGAAIAERMGPRRALALLFAGWGVTTILVGALPGRDHVPLWLTLGALLVLRGALGALQAPMYPVATGGTIAAWLPPGRWGLANALTNVGFTLGSAAAAPTGVWLILHLGWRLAIVVAGPPALVLAAAWWWYNRDDPRDHWRVNGQELAIIAAGRPVAPAAPVAVRWTSVVTDVPLLLLTVSYFALYYVFYLFFEWFYFYLTEIRHVPPQLAGYFTGMQWILGAIAAAAGGLLCDRLTGTFGSERGCRFTAMGGILAATPCLVLGAIAPDPRVMVVLLSISFASTQMVDAAYWVAAMRIAGPHAQLATGVLNTGGNLSGSAAAILVPLVAGAFGWVAAIGSAVAFALVAALLWIWIRIAAHGGEPVAA